jgi:tRNA threonylcarbamoyladenosine biosynthesis protein TsaE
MKSNLLSLLSRSEEDTLQFGIRLAEKFSPGDVVALFGPVGSGKTTLIRGICRAYGIEHTSSPTFIIMNEHHGSFHGRSFVIRHFDFYRVMGEPNLRELGIDEFLSDPEGIALIEWSEHVASHLPDSCWTIRIRVDDGDKRLIDVEHHIPAMP